MKRKTMMIGPLPFDGNGLPLLVAGPCVIESEKVQFEVAAYVAARAARYGVPYVHKGSFDKANRTSLDSFRGPGLAKGLAILRRIKRKLDLPLVVDIHLPEQARPVAAVADLLQIPAFLCRQTDLLVAAAKTGKPVNIKKGQWLAPGDIAHAAGKVRAAGNRQIIITERGNSFGYHNWVVDMRAFPAIHRLGLPVLFDATHSIQTPGGLGHASGGAPEYILPLVRAALAAGADGIYLETHPDPKRAKSDGPNMLPLDRLDEVLKAMALFGRIRPQGGW